MSRPSPIIGTYILIDTNMPNISVAVSCGYGTCFAVKTCDGLCHFIFSIDRVEMPFGSSEIGHIHIGIEA